MNAIALLVAALLPVTVIPAGLGDYPPSPAPVWPVSGVSSRGCVAPAGMTGLLDQDPTDEQLPWRRTGTGKVSVYFAAAGISQEWRTDMAYGAAQWNRSPCLDTHVVDACPTGTNCVTVSVVQTGDDGNFDAIERDGYTVGGHIDYLDTLTAEQKRNVAVHEMGHAVGLKHRKTTHVLMNGDTYDDVFDPDPTEYQNLLFDYGRERPALDQAAAAPGPAYTGTSPGVRQGGVASTSGGSSFGASAVDTAQPGACPVPALPATPPASPR